MVVHDLGRAGRLCQLVDALLGECARQLRTLPRTGARPPFPVLGPSGPLSVSVSIGAAMVCPGEQASGVLLRADQRLLKAKSTGRNRVVTSEVELAQLH